MKSQDEPAGDPPRPAPSRAGTGRTTLAAVLATVAVAALLLWVSQAILAHNRLQNCIDSGRRDCLPVAGGP